jgi:hypothetical protein
MHKTSWVAVYAVSLAALYAHHYLLLGSAVGSPQLTTLPGCLCHPLLLLLVLHGQDEPDTP